jgi:mono/diheme cytochrome c family protein
VNLVRNAISVLAMLAATAAAEDGPFGSGLYQVLEKVGCRSCHNPDGVASPTRLQFPEPDAAPERVEAFGRSLVTLVDRENPDKSLLLAKPTNRLSHAGGERIKPGSPDERVLRTWIGRLTTLSGVELASALKYREEEAAGSGKPAPRAELRRLTHSQYNHTVRDLLGDQTLPANRFPPEDFVNGFRNQTQSQNLSPLLVESYGAAAEQLARNAFRGGDTRGLVPCKASPACRSRFVREFGLKAFRRPLEPAEQQRYERLMAREADLLKGAQLVVEAMLQSSSFLFRIDETRDPKWKPYVAANRLAYAIWDSMPDAELFASAARGDLNTPQGVEKAARRMLDHPRAREALREYVSQWMRFDRILTASKDRRRYPQFTRETAVAMTEEASLFIGDLVWNDRNFMDLFTAGYGYANADLAAIYGVTAPAKEFDRVSFPAASERAGLLGQTLFLALTAKPEDSSPTARGLFVREQFLCQHVPEPPAGVNTNLPPVTEAKPQTNRDRMSEHATNPSCATCHNLIDPIGFGLERFDAIGIRREKFQLQFPTGRRGEGGGGWRAPMKSVQLDIDATGHVAGIPDSRFDSPSRLGAVLAGSSQCQECMVKQYFRYVSGRMETPADRPAIRQILADFAKSQFRFRELVVSLVRLREFPATERPVHVASDHKPR